MQNQEDMFHERKLDVIINSKIKSSKNTKNLSPNTNKKETQKLLAKKFKKLKHKALYINEEYEETSEIFSTAQKEFVSCMFNFCSNRKIHPPLGEKQKEETNLEQTSDEIKDLYREIVKATHPDKTKNLSEEEIQERTDLYNEVVQGKQDGNFWGLFKAALELDITLKNLSFSYLEEMEESINKIESKITTMKNDLMYKWFFCEQNIKDDIFDKLTQNSEKYE